MLATRMKMAAAGASEFSPLSIAGLQAWYRSDLGVTGSAPVTAWADQSGNGRNLSEGTNGPSLQSAVINGHDVLRFDGVNDNLVTSGFTVAQPLTIFAVVKLIANVLNDILLSTGTTNATPTIRERTTNIWRLDSNGLAGPEVTVDTTNFYLIKALFSGTSTVISANNGGDQTTASDLSGSAGLIRLGNLNGAAFSNFDIAELAVYNSAISGGNLSDFNTYIADRYGLSIS